MTGSTNSSGSDAWGGHGFEDTELSLRTLRLCWHELGFGVGERRLADRLLSRERLGDGDHDRLDLDDPLGLADVHRLPLSSLG
jgi:hypothetical protein